MSKVVDVRFTKYGKVGIFDTGGFELSKGARVLVETELGLALGTICSEPRDMAKECTLPKVNRLAGEQDLHIYEQNRRLEDEVYDFCYAKIQERALPMNLVSVDRLFDGGKVIVYFTADGRVDFRELVKDLVQRFRTRIEMRQIGVRHQAKMVGGLGNCGRQLCCTSFLVNFDPVSIKMAKEQNLSLNPTKISGMCGRLMCCLSYEYQYYESARRGIPKVGKRIKIEQEEGKVIRQNVLRRKLTVLLDSGEEREISYDDIVPPAGGRESLPEKKQESPEKIEENSPDPVKEKE